jgi:exonuclease SbcC
VRISYLELRNYRRFKDLKLQFPDGIIGILGFNGVGKTTIIESIAWALFGNVEEVVRTSRESVRRAAAGQSESCGAIVEFELGGTEYRIEREMGGKSLSMRAELRSKGTVLADGDKPVRRMVEKLLGMDHKSFFTSVFARQKELNALQNVAAGERKKVVLRMLRIDGIDDVLVDVRADKRDLKAKVEGAQKTLTTEDGREKEKVLKERLPEITSALELAAKQYVEAERRESQAAKELEAVKAKRDELKKDDEAYNSAASDLKAKQSSLFEQGKRLESITGRIETAESKLKRLPELERQDSEFKSAAERKETLEKARVKHEKAKAVAEEIERDRADMARRTADIEKLAQGLGKTSEIEAQIAALETSKLECEESKGSLSGRMGELRAKVAKGLDSAEKDRKKLKEIQEAGRKGTCPTCERVLEDAYDLLVKKLAESAAEADRQAKEFEADIAKLESELQGVIRKEDAIRKKRARLDEEAIRARRLESSLAERRGELAKLSEKVAQREKALSDLGDVSFEEKDFLKAKEEYERLKAAHDEFTKLNSLKEQHEQLTKDLEAVKESIKRTKGEEQTFLEIVRTLEPKKGLFHMAIKELDEKTAFLNKAKDVLRRQGSAKDKAQADLDGVKRDLVEIERVKKTILEDSRRAEDLALLEDVVVNFKDDLIGRIAPTLSELASREIEAMTEGKYSKIELDDNYEMQVEDEGAMYPVSRFSGGESDLANLSLRLAISSIIADRTGANPMNLLILDEIFGSQDLNRKRSVMSALSRLSTQFRQIFLITHIEDIKDSMSSVIKVEEEEDGTSNAYLAG